jgi:uncharacterized protein
MDTLLDATEARVLGSLIEKEITTPEYYPLSLNALVNACNQKSSRDPVMQLDEITVERALARLQDIGLVRQAHDSRVPKFEHQARSFFDLRRPEIAVLCLLLLRGPQTSGELRNRSERLYTFDDIAAVQSVLERMSREVEEEGRKPRPALVTLQARQIGEKEARFAHLLSGTPVAPVREPNTSAASAERMDRLAQLESQVAELRALLDSAIERITKLENTASDGME